MPEPSRSGGPPWRTLGCLAIVLVAIPTAVAIVVKLSYDSAFPGSPLTFETVPPAASNAAASNAQLQEWRDRSRDGALAQFSHQDLASWLQSELAEVVDAGTAGPESRVEFAASGTRRIRLRLSWQLSSDAGWLAGRFCNLHLEGLFHCQDGRWDRVEIDHYAFGQFAGTPERGEGGSQVLELLAANTTVPEPLRLLFRRIQEFELQDGEVRLRLR